MVNGTGIYRTMGAGGKPSIAFVTDRSISFQIYERLYRDRKYLPSFDDLPWSGGEPKAEVTVEG